MVQRASERCGALVGVVGPSGAGKTTLLELLIPVLSQMGVRVGAVKHASHGFAADRPGKDSHRLYESGARAVSIVSNEQVACFRRRDDGGGDAGSLAAALDALPRDLDLVLVEGFSWEAVPRIVVLGGAHARSRADFERGEVLAVVRPRPVRNGAPGRPHFPESQLHSLAARVAERIGTRDAEPSDGAGQRVPARAAECRYGVPPLPAGAWRRGHVAGGT